ncbi:MAG: Enolase [Candidatus Curtissbacteria bacterium GW2011_GWA1_40_24]|uniref:Enolase n=1 Tax=Candidatus Curtissbacteria bacterium GW2011_GWA1_40_24 TaxID=1618406 RepID=A0A0G0RQQ4_9BACT|nr:MAG: Enolase [Candidatus Curtissbacteria bacterium GW2011_GWA1_40_24]
MAKIKKIISREILDSRGDPTIEATVILDDDSFGVFSTPSGLSIGKHETVELRDKDQARYSGKGVLRALEKIYSVISPSILGKDAAQQRIIDNIIIEADKTKDKSNLGANAMLAISGAVAKAQARSQNVGLYQYINEISQIKLERFEIPTPMFNILNGGLHGSGNVDFQEFLLIPKKSGSYSDNLRAGVEIYYHLKQTIAAHSGIVLVGDEGGYAPTLYSNVDALKLIAEAIDSAHYQLGLDVFLSLDVAATELKKEGSYRIKDRPIPLNSDEFIEFFTSLNNEYHLLSIEDPLAEDDWDDWKKLTEKIGKETIIVGDDLIATNLERLKKAKKEKACNGVIIKPNQAGTISETIDVAKYAKEANFKIVVSHRSGETNDDFIADFAVAIGADYAKFGAPARGERVAKYNRLLEIEHELSKI